MSKLIILLVLGMAACSGETETEPEQVYDSTTQECHVPYDDGRGYCEVSFVCADCEVSEDCYNAMPTAIDQYLWQLNHGECEE